LSQKDQVPCPRKIELLQFWEFNIYEYTRAVRKLIAERAFPKGKWDLAWDLADKARRKSETMLEQLKKHKEEHGC